MSTSSFSESISSPSRRIKSVGLTIDIQNELYVLYLLFVKALSLCISNHCNAVVVILWRNSYRNVYILIDAEEILNFVYWNVSSGKGIFIHEYCLRHSSKWYVFVNILLGNSNNLNVSGYHCHKLWWRDFVTGRRIGVEFGPRPLWMRKLHIRALLEE